MSFGQRTPNVGITRFQVRRSTIDPIGYEILAEVANRSDEPVKCRLEIDLGEDVVDVVPLSLEPGGTWSKPVSTYGPVTMNQHGNIAFAVDITIGNQSSAGTFLWDFAAQKTTAVRFATDKPSQVAAR